MDQELDPALAHADAVALTPGDAALKFGDEQIAPAWGAVVAMMLGVTALLTAEFLPSGVLTPMARDLGVSPGLAGQAVTATSLAGLVGALFTPRLTRSFNRKPVLLSFSILLVISNLLVALAPNITFLLAARIVLGLAIALRATPPLAAGAAACAIFAIFHGHAHGAELPQGASGLGYALGFVLATAALHGAGLGLAGLLAARAPLLARVAGGGLALAGVAILAS